MLNWETWRLFINPGFCFLFFTALFLSWSYAHVLYHPLRLFANKPMKFSMVGVKCDFYIIIKRQDGFHWNLVDCQIEARSLGQFFHLLLTFKQAPFFLDLSQSQKRKQAPQRGSFSRVYCICRKWELKQSHTATFLASFCYVWKDYSPFTL